MKKIITFTLILAVAGFSASAQERREMKGQKHGMHQGQKSDMMKDLNLSEAQKAQLKADREIYKAKMEALRKDENITVKEMKARQKAIHDEQQAKMQALLTPEQKAKIAADKAAMQTKRKGMDGQRAEAMKEKLGLSNEQAEKLKAHNQEVHSKLKAIQGNSSLTMDQKKEQMTAVKEASKAQRKNILTAEQIKRMEEMKKDGKGKKDWKEKKTIKQTKTAR